MTESSLIPVPLSALLAMGLCALIMVLTPGPNMIYLLSRSAGQGRSAGLISLAGTTVGFVIYLLIANLGLAMVFVTVPWLFIGLKVAGVIYLAHLAWRVLRPGGRGPLEVHSCPVSPPGRLFRMGLLTNLLNPKAAVMYLTLIPQFVDPLRGSTTAQGLILGGTQIVVSVTVNAAIVLAAGGLAAGLARHERWVTWQRRILGTLLGGASLFLLVEVPRRAGS